MSHTCLRSLAFWSAGRASKADLIEAKTSELWKPGTLISDIFVKVELKERSERTALFKS